MTDDRTDNRTDVATLAARLDAVERALTDDDRAASPARPPRSARSRPPDAADEVDAHENAVRELERRVGELAAELDAVRGLLGGVEAVNESVERRADLALAAVEQLAAERDDGDGGDDGLVVERLSEDGDEGTGTPDDDADAGSDSLAARLREAL